ncbi:MAG: SPOR domain-containing protein [Candidatus Omnitrophota bacterium]
MKINYRESQIDFLAQAAGSPQAAVSPRYMSAQISLSLENLVILSIVAIMLVIFSFSMGIERGKGIASAVHVPAGDAAQADATAASAAPAVPGKADRFSEKAEAKGKAETPRFKVFPAPSQTVAQAKGVSANVLPPSGGYTVQVASYKGVRYAQREADKLKQKGFDDVYVLAKGAYTIVCVGNFQKKEDASDVKRQLKGRYQDFVVRRL